MVLEGDFLLCQGDWTVVAICCRLVLYEREVKETNLRDRRIDCDISEVCVSIEVLLKCVLFVLAFQYEKRDVEGVNLSKRTIAFCSMKFTILLKTPLQLGVSVFEHQRGRLRESRHQLASDEETARQPAFFVSCDAFIHGVLWSVVVQMQLLSTVNV